MTPKLSIGVVLGVAMLLRVPFVGEGLPCRYNSDEAKRIQTAVDMVAEGSLNPGWFGHPGQTIIYPLAGIVQSLYGLGRAGGRFDSREAFLGWYYSNPSVVFLSARVFMLVVALGVIALTILMAAEVGGSAAATLAGLAVAASPLHITQSTLARSSDIIMSGFLLLSTLLSIKIFRMGRVGIRPATLWLVYGLAGGMVGLSVASKYYGVFGATAIITAHFLTWGVDPGRLKLLVFSGVASLAGAFVAGPFLFLDFPSVLAAVAIENRAMHLSANGSGFLPDTVWLLDIIRRQGIGSVLFLFSAAGMALGLKRDWRESAIILGPPAFILLFLSALNLRWDRWTLGLVPFAAIYAGVFLSRMLEWSSRRRRPALWSAACIAFVVLGLSWNVRHSIRAVRYLGLPDSRELAGAWIEENVPPHSTLFVEVQGPQLDRREFRIVGGILASGNLPILDGASRGFLRPAPPTTIFNLRDIRDLRRAGVEYVILTNYERRFRESPYQDEYAREISLYNALHEIGIQVYSSSEEGRTKGPPIQILTLAPPRDRIDG